jgi:hypothetical protein
MPLLRRRVAGELYVNQAKVSLVLPVTTADGKKQFLYLLGVCTVKKELDTVFPSVYRLTVLYLPMVFHHLHTDKKENKIFLICKEIQKEAVA